MNTYRSKLTIEAVQYTGGDLFGITCEASSTDPMLVQRAREANGCDSSRFQMPHVHANVVGGMVVLKRGDWIFPVPGGPWGVASDDRFRASWEVPDLPPPADIDPVVEPVEPAVEQAFDPEPEVPAVAAYRQSKKVEPVDPEVPVTPIAE